MSKNFDILKSNQAFAGQPGQPGGSGEPEGLPPQGEMVILVFSDPNMRFWGILTDFECV